MIYRFSILLLLILLICRYTYIGTAYKLHKMERVAFIQQDIIQQLSHQRSIEDSVFLWCMRPENRLLINQYKLKNGKVYFKR